MKKILIGILLASASYSHAQTINAEQIKKDNVTIRGNALHQLRADTSFLATRYYVDSVAGSGTFDTTSLSNRIDLKLDSVRRIPGTDTVVEYYDNGTQRFAFIDSVSGATIAAAAWALTGNAGTTPGTNFIGTTDSAAWVWKTNNRQWAALQVKGPLWIEAGLSDFNYDTTAINSEQLKTANLAIGDSSMMNLRFGPDTAIAHNNTAFGFWALRDLVNGWGNTAIGAGSQTYTIGAWGSTALTNPGTPFGRGYENTSVGFLSMHLNRTGYENTALGTGALYKNPKAVHCVAVGVGALTNSVDTALGSVAIGFLALRDYTTSSGAGGNTAIGGTSLQSTTIGYNNCALGGAAGRDNTTGISNTFLGQFSGAANTTGSGNCLFGFQSGENNGSGNHNIFIGSRAGANLANLSGLILVGFGAFNASPTDDTTKTPIYIKTNSGSGSVDSSTTVLEFNGKVRHNDGSNASLGQRPYLANTNGLMLWSNPEINTTAGDAATIDKVSGRFRKDTSGSTFTLTNSFITANSIIQLTYASDPGITGYDMFVVAGAGSATITFTSAGVAAAPASNTDINFTIEN